MPHDKRSLIHRDRAPSLSMPSQKPDSDATSPHGILARQASTRAMRSVPAVTISSVSITRTRSSSGKRARALKPFLPSFFLSPMFHSKLITGIALITLIAATTPSTQAAPSAHLPFTSGNLRGPERVANSPHYSHREERVKTRERERLFYQERISNLDDRGVHGRLTHRELQKHLNRYD